LARFRGISRDLARWASRQISPGSREISLPSRLVWKRPVFAIRVCTRHGLPLAQRVPRLVSGWAVPAGCARVSIFIFR
jgi:hypothetical protein